MELWLNVGIVLLIVILSLVGLFKKNSLPTALKTLGSVVAFLILLWDVVGALGLGIHLWSWECPDDACDDRVKLWMALPWLVPISLWAAAAYVSKRKSG